jgi:hypothetical protein
MDFGCASYCEYAEQCLGTLPDELLAKKEELLKDRVAIEMKRYFKTDFKRIGHASKVARYAERIGKLEKGNLAVILAAAYLHDIGIKDAERIYHSTAPKYQEELGPPIAREILVKLGANEKLIDEVFDIVGHHHHPRPDDNINYKAVYDADMIVNIEENHKEKSVDKEYIAKIIDKSFLTETGKKIATEVLLK